MKLTPDLTQLRNNSAAMLRRELHLFFSDLINTELRLHNSYPKYPVGNNILKAQENIRNIFT